MTPELALLLYVLTFPAEAAVYVLGRLGYRGLT